MSDIRKAIMARLGEFARPGVPAAVLDGISAGVNALYSQAREYHNEGDRELAKSRKKDADDLGAIAVLVRSGDGGAEHAKRIASSIFKLDTEVRDWVGDSMWEWLRRMKAIHSRPGAKAEMAASVRRGIDPKKGGQWINGTWDGGTWSAMVFSEPSEAYGIPEFPHISKLAINPKDKPGIGGVIVNYDRGWDIKPSTPELQKAYREIAQIATAEVNKAVKQGWYSRTGEKARMGIEKSTDVKNIGNVDRDGYSYGADRVIGRDGDVRFRSYFVDKSKGIGNREISPLFASAEQAKSWIKNKLDKWTRTHLFPKRNASRPGAKSTNALSDACWQGYEAVGTKKQDGKTVPNCVPKATAAKPESQDIESEEVKAGLKLMEKADEKVSEKIRTLIKEGKPQDQAVAIALDMKRRGEL